MGKSALLERWEFWNFVSPCENRERTVRCSAGSHRAAQLNECKADKSLSVSQIIYKFTVFTHPACLSTIKHQAFSTFAINFSPNQSITCIPLNSSIVQLFPQHIFSLLGLNALPRPRPLRIFASYIPFTMSKLAVPKYIIYWGKLIFVCFKCLNAPI